MNRHQHDPGMIPRIIFREFKTVLSSMAWPKMDHLADSVKNISIVKCSFLPLN